MMECREPSSTRRLTSSTARRPPKSFVTEWVSRITMRRGAARSQNIRRARSLMPYLFAAIQILRRRARWCGLGALELLDQIEEFELRVRDIGQLHQIERLECHMVFGPDCESSLWRLKAQSFHGFDERCRVDRAIRLLQALDH